MRMFAVIGIMLLLALSVQGCGRKGSLVMPPIKPEAQPAAQVAPQSAPDAVQGARP